jgi:predicted TPR repeat methyltransferase
MLIHFVRVYLTVTPHSFGPLPLLLRRLTNAKPDWRWQLTASGRFAHRKEYVEAVGARHNLDIFHYEPLNDFRFENGVGVRGHIFVMQKTSQIVKDEL